MATGSNGSLLSVRKNVCSNYSRTGVAIPNKETHQMNLKLEVIVIPVSDVDRAKAFYEKLGFRLDIDYAADDKFRVLQFTPPGSDASIIFGKGITSRKPGSADGLTLAVEDVDAARQDLARRGVSVSEVFNFAGG